MKWKKIISIIALLIAIIFLMTGFAQAAGLYDSVRGTAGDYIDARENYYLDMKEVSFFKAPLAVMFNGIANMIFGLINSMGAWAVGAVKFALSTDIFSIVDDFITPLFGGINTYIFGGFAGLAIGIAAFILLLRLVSHRTMYAFTGLLVVIAVVLCSTIFFAHPMTVLSKVSEITTDLSADVVNAPYEAVEPGSVAKPEDKSASLVWSVIVHKPWQILEFGDTDIADLYQDDILSLACDTNARNDKISDLNESKGLFPASTAVQLERIVTGVILLCFSFIVFILIMLFAVLIVGYQMFAIFLALIGTFVFLLALIPRYGLRLVGRWALKVLMALTVKVVLVFVLAVLFVLMDFIYGLSGTYGLMPVLILLISTILILWIKRDAVWDLFKGYGSGSGINGALDRTLNSNFNALQEGSYAARRVQADRSARAMRGFQYDSYDRNDQKQVYRNAQGDSFASGEAAEEGASDGFVRFSRKRKGNEVPTDRRPKNQQAQTHVQYTREQKQKGIDLLRRSYFESKNKSELEAQRLGRDPEYTLFVQRTDALRAVNPRAEFDARDIEKAARIVQRTEASGGRFEDIQIGGNRNEKASTPTARPRHLQSQRIDPGPAEQRGTQVEVTAVRSPKGIEFFKSNFGEEKGEQYFQQLSDRYGEQAVSNFRPKLKDPDVTAQNQKRQLSYTEVNRQVRAQVREQKTAPRRLQEMREEGKGRDTNQKPGRGLRQRTDK